MEYSQDRNEKDIRFLRLFVVSAGAILSLVTIFILSQIYSLFAAS